MHLAQHNPDLILVMLGICLSNEERRVRTCSNHLAFLTWHKRICNLVWEICTIGLAASSTEAAASGMSAACSAIASCK